MEVMAISKTAQKFNGETYYLCGNYYQRKGKRLHRAVWEHHNGPVPKGYHVHHKDGDRSNNDIDNLDLVLAKDHLRNHMSTEERKNKSRACIANAIKAAPKWHRGVDGKQWHSDHAKQIWEEKEPTRQICSHCGKEFLSKGFARKNGNNFCGNNCRSAHRRETGVDNVERRCVVCGSSFVVNKYSKQENCSHECARIRRWELSR